MPETGDASKVGIVVIGRNEGVRLRKCFESMLPTDCPIVYVDSGSSDSSVDIARSFHVKVIELDPVRPFSAARARNEGFERLRSEFSDLRFVQFLDGDCTLAKGWLDAAAKAMLASDRRAAVMGHLLERNIDASSYNRLCALEWKRPVGDMPSGGGLGGIAMIRAAVLEQLGGYNPEVIAGEDSELGVRMVLAGYKVTQVDHPMATHDADITNFVQWWRRSVRAGHAIGQRAYLNGTTARDCIRERNSTWFWGVCLPAFVMLVLVPTSGWSFVLAGGYLILALRIVRHRRGLGENWADALLYAKFNLIAKFANAVGLVKFHLNRLARRYEIIEYK